MASKSAVVQGMWFGAEFLSNVYKAVVKRGGTPEEMHDAMKTEGNLADELAELIVSRAKSVKQSAFKNLKLIAESVLVSADSFTKDSFFKNGPVKFWLGDNFKNWILSAMPEAIPGFTSGLTQTQLTEPMFDSEIRNELGNPEPFTVSEFAAVLKSLIEHQPSGEAGTLLTNGYANIFYVKLANGRVVAVSAGWFSGSAEWSLNANDLGGNGWRVGDCVFSRS